MKTFWEVIYDDSKRTMEVIGSSSDDTRLTNNTYEMQQAGMKVHCQTADISASKESIKVAGYTHEDNLYSRLLNEYEQLTKKQLKRW
jgi:hypothetical protein